MKVILTHDNTDFDALAAQLAASKLYPEATPVLARRLNREVRAFVATYGDQLPFVSPDELKREFAVCGLRPVRSHALLRGAFMERAYVLEPVASG